MTDKYTQEIQGMVGAFILDYVRTKLRKQSLTFDSFVSRHQNYQQLLSELEGETLKRDIPLEELVYDSMTPDQRKSVGVLFRPNTSHSNNSFDDHLNYLIENSPQYQQFQKILPNLTKREREQLLNKLAQDIYSTLTGQERKKYSSFTVKRHLLNLGFIHLTRRGSYESAQEVILRYPALFKDLPEVVDRILDRYIEEKIISTPKGRIQETLMNLRAEIRRVYIAVEKGKNDT